MDLVVDRVDLERELRDLGLCRGTMVMVHSSLSSFGHLEGGSQTLIAVLQEVVGFEGLIMMPTFTYGRGIYDPNLTPSQTGMVSEHFRNMEGVFRSSHPTHSVAAWGKRAGKIVQGHDVEAPFAEGTPLHQLITGGGYVLLVGVTHIANSAIHVAQELARVPYLDRPKKVRVARADGSVGEMIVRRAGCSLGFDQIGPVLEVNKLGRKTQAGNATLFYVHGLDLVQTTVAVLRDNPLAFLCNRPDCFACNEARTMTALASVHNRGVGRK